MREGLHLQAKPRSSPPPIPKVLPALCQNSKNEKSLLQGAQLESPFTDWAASFHWDEMHSKNASVVGQKWKIQDDKYSEEN